jgi:hypothetical protein
VSVRTEAEEAQGGGGEEEEEAEQGATREHSSGSSSSACACARARARALFFSPSLLRVFCLLENLRVRLLSLVVVEVWEGGRVGHTGEGGRVSAIFFDDFQEACIVE